MADDAIEDAARLITDLGRCYARARRYRAIAAECEERFLGRALAIGSVLRVHARAVGADSLVAGDAVRELTQLIADCDAAIQGVHDSATYRAARCAWDEGRFLDVAAQAAAIFDAVVPDAAATTLYVPVAVTSDTRRGDHFLPAPVLVERIVALLRDGIPRSDPPPEIGADERLGVVMLEDDAETTGSPVALAIEAESLPLPRFRLEPAGEVLVYTPRLRVPARVRLAAGVSDEWWAIRPDAYARYATALTEELAACGVGVDRLPGAGS